MKQNITTQSSKYWMAIIDIKKHRVLSCESYFFDTNIWLYIFGPMAGSNQRKQRLYSQLLKDITDRGSTIYINSIILSEYINRSLRISFEQWKDINGCANTDFKKGYRVTSDYLDSLVSVRDEVESILQVATKRPDEFNNIKIDIILNRMNQSCDFNDSYIISTCIRGDIKLVSDDADMQYFADKIQLITSVPER